jgi:predicted dehydrogenase
MIGYKKMGRAHSFAYGNVGKFFDVAAVPELQVLCGRNGSEVSKAAERFGWREAATDWQQVVARDDIELIDVCSSNDLHDHIAIAAAEKGKHVFCEKPLAVNLARARAMTEAALKAEQVHGAKHMACFNYRFVPAIVQAKKMIEQGLIGRIYHYRSKFLQDWLVSPDAPSAWRLDKEAAGSGALGDLGSHMIDLAHYLVGDIGEVTAIEKTFIEKRLDPASGELRDVTVDDATAVMMDFACGAIGTLEASRFANGHKCTNEFEISGSRGSLRFNFQNFNELEYFSLDDAGDVQGFRKITVTRPGIHPYADAWWGQGHVIGFENTFVHAVKELLDAIGENRRPSPSFVDGLRCQEVQDAIEASLRDRRWQSVKYSYLN